MVSIDDDRDGEVPMEDGDYSEYPDGQCQSCGSEMIDDPNCVGNHICSDPDCSTNNEANFN